MASCPGRANESRESDLATHRGRSPFSPSSATPDRGEAVGLRIRLRAGDQSARPPDLLARHNAMMPQPKVDEPLFRDKMLERAIQGLGFLSTR